MKYPYLFLMHTKNIILITQYLKCHNISYLSLTPSPFSISKIAKISDDDILFFFKSQWWEKAEYLRFMSDNRQKSNGNLFSDIFKRCLWVLPLREWVGYWQGNHRSQELISMTVFSPEEISQSYFKNLNKMMKYELAD